MMEQISNHQCVRVARGTFSNKLQLKREIFSTKLMSGTHLSLVNLNCSSAIAPQRFRCCHCICYCYCVLYINIKFISQWWKLISVYKFMRFVELKTPALVAASFFSTLNWLPVIYGHAAHQPNIAKCSYSNKLHPWEMLQMLRILWPARWTASRMASRMATY